MLYPDEAPIAYSMVSLIRQGIARVGGPYQTFMLLWIAFNNVYFALSEKGDIRRKLRLDDDGTPRTRRVGNLELPLVETPSELAQINAAIAAMDDSVQEALVLHESTRFFVYRTPKWGFTSIERDRRNQRLNGVINVGLTTSADYPVWSPIDQAAYEKYLHDRDNETCAELVKQIVHLLYTVRNNTFHGGKRIDDANDSDVIRNALPLLALVVSRFLSDASLELLCKVQN